METRPPTVRIVLADPVPAARTSLRRLVEGIWGWEVTGEAQDGFEAVRLARATRADVLLVDATIDGLALHDVRELLVESGTAVIGLLERPERHASQTGPSALKSVPAEALRRLVLAVLADEWSADGTPEVTA